MEGVEEGDGAFAAGPDGSSDATVRLSREVVSVVGCAVPAAGLLPGFTCANFRLLDCFEFFLFAESKYLECFLPRAGFSFLCLGLGFGFVRCCLCLQCHLLELFVEVFRGSGCH